MFEHAAVHRGDAGHGTLPNLAVSLVDMSENQHCTQSLSRFLTLSRARLPGHRSRSAQLARGPWQQLMHGLQRTVASDHPIGEGSIQSSEHTLVNDNHVVVARGRLA